MVIEAILMLLGMFLGCVCGWLWDEFVERHL